jgi:hypothetical protein
LEQAATHKPISKGAIQRDMRIHDKGKVTVNPADLSVHAG